MSMGHELDDVEEVEMDLNVHDVLTLDHDENVHGSHIDHAKFGFYSSGRKQSFDKENVPKMKDHISEVDAPDWLQDMSRGIHKRDSEADINAHIDWYENRTRSTNSNSNIREMYANGNPAMPMR